MKDLIISKLSFFAIWRVKNKNIFSFSSLKGKGMKPCFPIQALISGTVVHMAVFETEITESSKRSATPKPGVWGCGRGVSLRLKDIQCVCRGR